MAYFVDFAVSCPQSLCIFYILTEVFVLSVFYHVRVSHLWTTITEVPPFSPGSIIQGISHINVRVEDLREAEEYYKRVLGFHSPADSGLGLGLVFFISHLGFLSSGLEQEEDENCQTIKHPSGLTIKLTRLKNSAIAEKKRELENIIGIALKVDDCHKALLFLRSLVSKDCQILQTFPINLEDEIKKLPGSDGETDKGDENMENATLSGSEGDIKQEDENMEKTTLAGSDGDTDQQDENMKKAKDTDKKDEDMEKARDTDKEDDNMEKTFVPLFKSIQWMDRFGIKWQFEE